MHEPFVIRAMDRLSALNRLKDRELSQLQAAETLGLSTRQVRRIALAFDSEGSSSLLRPRGGAKVRYDAQFKKEVILSNLDGANGFMIDGVNVNDNTGAAVNSGIDVNADGIQDIVIGAPNAYQATGCAYVVFGSYQPRSVALRLSTLDGREGVVINGINEGYFTGSSVSAVGDVNHDGVGDVLIGASQQGSYGAGQSYIVYGRANWISPIYLSWFTGQLGFIINGIGSGSGSGSAVGGLGDINGDGISDFVIGAPNASNYNVGQAYAIFGRGAWPSAIDLRELNGMNGFIMDGARGGDFTGASVAGAGDINGDGVDDVIIGAVGNSGYGLGYGYVVFGSKG